MKMICIKCKKEIVSDSNYYKFIEMDEEKEVSTDYAHRECWDNFMKQLDSAGKSLNTSNKLLGALGNHMKKMGMLPDEEVELVC